MAGQLKSKQSALVAASDLNLFQIPPTQVGIERKRWIEVLLRNTLMNGGPFTFCISANPYMLDLSKNYLYVECRITKDGEPIKSRITGAGADGAQVPAPYTAPIQMIGKSFIKKVQISLNGEQIYDSGPNYAYKVYLETELMYGKGAKEGHLATAGYAEDVGDNIDSDNNAGFKARAAPYRDGAWVHLMSPVHADLFNQSRYLLPQIELTLTIYPNSDKFNLLNFSGGDYHLDFQTIKFYVKSVELSKSYYLSLERHLHQTTAKYPLRTAKVFNLHVTQNRSSLQNNELFGGRVPRRVLIGAVAADRYNGDITKSPFFFEPFGLSEIYILCCGDRYPAIPITSDFSSATGFTQSYIQLLDCLSYSGTDSTNCLTLDKYKKGWTIYGIDLTSNQDAESSEWNLERRGSTCIYMNFGSPIPAGGIELIIYSEFDQILSIDSYRNAFIDKTL